MSTAACGSTGAGLVTAHHLVDVLPQSTGGDSVKASQVPHLRVQLVQVHCKTCSLAFRLTFEH